MYTGYFVVKKLAWNVHIKALWYTIDILCDLITVTLSYYRIKYNSSRIPLHPYFAFNLAFFIVLMDFIKIAVLKLKLADFISNFDNW